MNQNEYLIASESTERKYPDGLDLDTVDYNHITSLLYKLLTNGIVFDKLKKKIVYGKDIEASVSLDEFSDVHHRLSTINDDMVHLNQNKAELFHAVLGKITEQAELVEQFMGYIFFDDPLDIVNVKEELGDDEWYNGIIYRILDLDRDDILDKNIEKLTKVRYKKGTFNSTEAEKDNRDLDAERLVYEDKNE